MTTKEKYELIDKTKVSAKVLEILEKMEKASSNFTNAEVNSRVDTALDKIIEGLKVSKPEALLSVSDAKKEVKKEKKEAEEKNKGKDLSKKKDTDDKTGLPKKDTVEERKDIIKKESESEKEARERAKKELEKENEKAKDVIESQLEKLNRIILEDPALRGFNTGTSATGGGKSTPLIDAERKAIPRGRRVSQKGRKNQYGASAGGRVYWENRENRSDRKSPDYPTGKPYLAKGGMTENKTDVIKLYYHETSGGAEYLCSSKVKGSKDEGSFDSEYVVRIDGATNFGGELRIRKGGDIKRIILYYHKTNGGAEYLCSSKVKGSKGEGNFDSEFVVRIDGATDFGGELRISNMSGNKLAKGGNVYASDDLYEVKMVQDGVELDSKLIRARNKGEARMIFEDMYQEKYQDEFGAFDLEIDIAKDRMADGGFMADGGETDGELYIAYENTFNRFDSDVPVPMEDFEKLLHAYQKQLSGDKLDVVKYEVLKGQMGNYLGHKTVEEMEAYFVQRRDSYKMAHGGGVPYKPYGKTKGRFTLKYEDDGEQQIEIWSSLEEATNSARRYVNPKLGYTNVHIYDESGKEYFFADGGMMADGGKTEQLYSSIKRDRLRALEDEISTLNLMLKKLENENNEESYQESQNLREYKTILEVKKLNLEDIGYDKGGMMADGGEVDFSERMAKMRSAYENLQMSVKGKIASAIGIDEAVAIMDTDYSIHPFNLIFGAVRGGLLELDEINKDLVNEAVDEAERVTDDYRDSGQGIGGSDMTYFTQNVLNSAGYKTGFINNTLKRVDADGNELVIDKYEMKF
jgi:hypothetical protein